MRSDARSHRDFGVQFRRPHDGPLARGLHSRSSLSIRRILDIGLVVSECWTRPTRARVPEASIDSCSRRPCDCNTMSHLDIATLLRAGSSLRRRRGGLILVGAMGAEKRHSVYSE